MRNIYLAYILTYLKNSWFWLGVWVLYYLRFTDYAGVGLLEAVMIVTATLAEIPTGAVADLLGKKKTLSLAFLLFGLGNLMMGVAPTFVILTFAVTLTTVGGALHSGTHEALIYDSLKERGLEKGYDRVLANDHTILLIAFAVSSVIGGFMYKISPGLPFIAVGVSNLLGFVLTFFLHEPLVDSETFSLMNYLRQTRMGFKQLFKSVIVTKQTLYLLCVGFFVNIFMQFMSDAQLVEFGFNAVQLGVVISAMFLCAAAASQLTPWLNKSLSLRINFVIQSAIFIASLLISPFLGVMVGAGVVILRTMSMTININITSEIINGKTLSKYRATTLSTYDMLHNLPYVFLAYSIGAMIDVYTAHWVAVGLGLALIVVLVALTMGYRFIRTQEG